MDSKEASEPDEEREATIVGPEWQELIDEAVANADAMNRSVGHLNNIRSYGKHNALMFQSLGICDPEDVDRDAFTRFHGRLKKKYAPEYQEKRNGILKLMFKAGGLDDQLTLTNNWRGKKRDREVRWFTDPEVFAQQTQALRLAEDEATLPHAVAGFIVMRACPRVSDIAAARWEDFDFENYIFSYVAKKNGSRCIVPIDPLWAEILLRWKPKAAELEGGDEWVFPKALGSTNGGPKTSSPTISEKTIRKWLNEKVRDLARLPDGSRVQKLSPHHWRHTNTMRILLATNDYYLAKLVLGDEIRTIEKRYSSMVLSDNSRKSLHQILANPSRTSHPDIWSVAQFDRLPDALEALESGTLTNGNIDDSIRQITLCTQVLNPEDFQRGDGSEDSDGDPDDGDDGLGGSDGCARVRPNMSFEEFRASFHQPARYSETERGLNTGFGGPAAIRTRVSSSGG